MRKIQRKTIKGEREAKSKNKLLGQKRVIRVH